MNRTKGLLAVFLLVPREGRWLIAPGVAPLELANSTVPSFHGAVVSTTRIVKFAAQSPAWSTMGGSGPW